MKNQIIDEIEVPRPRGQLEKDRASEAARFRERAMKNDGNTDDGYVYRCKTLRTVGHGNPAHGTRRICIPFREYGSCNQDKCHHK